MPLRAAGVVVVSSRWVTNGDVKNPASSSAAGNTEGEGGEVVGDQSTSDDDRTRHSSEEVPDAAFSGYDKASPDLSSYPLHQPDALPSARQLRERLPSLEELQAQLQKSLERSGPGDVSFQKIVDRQDEDFSVSLPMQPAVEEGEDLSSEKDRYILFAYKALLWGTFYSIVGVGCLTVLVMYAFSLHSVEDVLHKVREKTQRDMTLLRIRGEESTGSVTVKHYDLDFTQPTKVFEQVREIWSLVMEEVEQAKDDGKEEKRNQ